MYQVVLRRVPGRGFRKGSRWNTYPSKKYFDEHVRPRMAENHIEIVEEGVTRERAMELIKKDPLEKGDS